MLCYVLFLTADIKKILIYQTKFPGPNSDAKMATSLSEAIQPQIVYNLSQYIAFCCIFN